MAAIQGKLLKILRLLISKLWYNVIIYGCTTVRTCICMCLNDIFFIIILVCPNGTEYRHCSWNLSCSDITGVRRCKEQSPCTSGCFCSDGTVLQDGVCSNMGTCSGITTHT